MTFEPIEKKLASLRDPEHGEAPLARIGAWPRALGVALEDAPLRDPAHS